MASRQDIEERLDWRAWTTPKRLREKPIHRWFVFPHSYTTELVHCLIDEWGLGRDDVVLDPFAGAGTTILGAKERGVPARGYDLSPLAVLAARTKVAPPHRRIIESGWSKLQEALEPDWSRPLAFEYPALVREALPGRLLVTFDWIKRQIRRCVRNGPAQDFFLLALLGMVPRFTRAVAAGGWLKWTNRRRSADKLSSLFSAQVATMLGDLPVVLEDERTQDWTARIGDARFLPEKKQLYSAVVTSPPYPNRHDYTRVFGVELMLGLLNWEETRQLRYQSFHSHPEAKPRRPECNGYKRPRALRGVVEAVRDLAPDPRLPAMLEGYFLDMYLCLRETRRVCRPGAHVAFVVGNAQYYGLPLAVDEFTANAGEQAGLSCEKIVVARYRGNSAQQMGIFGRVPSRESVVIFRVPAGNRARTISRTET